MMRCKQCKLVNYCSVPCQRQDWRRGHKAQCELTAKTRAMTGPNNQRLVRLFGAWVEIALHPLDSILDAYYGIIRLENEICGKKVVEIWIALDYNKRTFVPIPDPVHGTPFRLLDIHAFRRDNPIYKEALSKTDFVCTSLKLRSEYNQVHGMYVIRGHACSSAAWLPWQNALHGTKLSSKCSRTCRQRDRQPCQVRTISCWNESFLVSTSTRHEKIQHHYNPPSFVMILGRLPGKTTWNNSLSWCNNLHCMVLLSRMLYTSRRHSHDTGLMSSWSRQKLGWAWGNGHNSATIKSCRWKRYCSWSTNGVRERLRRYIRRQQEHWTVLNRN
jgi:MYND finger